VPFENVWFIEIPYVEGLTNPTVCTSAFQVGTGVDSGVRLTNGDGRRVTLLVYGEFPEVFDEISGGVVGVAPEGRPVFTG
jgi:hypothetical protein